MSDVKICLMSGFQMSRSDCISLCLPLIILPTGSEERGVLGVGSIPVAILLSCQNVKTFALQINMKICDKYEYSWAATIRNTSEAVLRSQYSPWPSY